MERNEMPGGAGDINPGAEGAEYGGFRSETSRSSNIGDDVREGLADVGSEARERVATAKNTLADKLDSGANRLEERGQEIAQQGESTFGPDGRVQKATTRVASGMHDTADWLREHDLNDVRTDIEQQVRAHPGRSLLIAVGVGYLIGKAFRR